MTNPTITEAVGNFLGEMVDTHDVSYAVELVRRGAHGQANQWTDRLRHKSGLSSFSNYEGENTVFEARDALRNVAQELERLVETIEEAIEGLGYSSPPAWNGVEYPRRLKLGSCFRMYSTMAELMIRYFTGKAARAGKSRELQMALGRSTAVKSWQEIYEGFSMIANKPIKNEQQVLVALRDTYNMAWQMHRLFPRE